jgi:hypothetical protein
MAHEALVHQEITERLETCPRWDPHRPLGGIRPNGGAGIPLQVVPEEGGAGNGQDR